MRFKALIGFICLGLIGVQSAALAGRVLTMGIVPQMPPWMLAKRWTPILNAWSRVSGYRIHLRTAPTIASFERRVTEGRYDLVYLNPADYLRDQTIYRAFARGNDWLQALLIVGAAKARHGLSDLNGKRLAFPAAHALAASVEPRQYLKQQGIAFTPLYVGSQESVYLSVAAGLFAGGGGIGQTYEELSPALRHKLRVIWRGPKTLPHPFAAKRDLPVLVVRRVTQALLHLPASVRPALIRLGFKDGFVAASGAQYRAVGAVPH